MGKLWINRETGEVKGELAKIGQNRVVMKGGVGKLIKLGNSELGDNRFNIEIIRDTHIIMKNYLGRQIHLLLNHKTITVEQLFSDETIPFKFRDGTGSSPVSLALNRVFPYQFVLDYVRVNFEVIEISPEEWETIR